MKQISSEELEKEQVKQMKKKLLSQILSKEAYERLGRVKSVNPQLANQVEYYLIQIYQTGRIDEQITDKKMKDILKTLSQKKEINIRRK